MDFESRLSNKRYLKRLSTKCKRYNILDLIDNVKILDKNELKKIYNCKRESHTKMCRVSAICCVSSTKCSRVFYYFYFLFFFEIIKCSSYVKGKIVKNDRPK